MKKKTTMTSQSSAESVHFEVEEYNETGRLWKPTNVMYVPFQTQLEAVRWINLIGGNFSRMRVVKVTRKPVT